MALVTCVLNSDDIIAAINQAKEEIMAEAKQYADQFTALAQEMKDAVAPLPGAIDAFEARITQLVKDAGVTADVAAQFDAALSEFRDAVAGVKSSVADAADGVDEAATSTTEPPTT